jgi:hypothetical protein
MTMKRSTYQRMLCTALALMAGLLLSGAAFADSKNETRLRTQLTGNAIGGKTPEGHADFRMDTSRGRTRLNVEVEHVNLPAGTVLTVMITHGTSTTSVGTFTLDAFGEGELELNSQDGDTVPAVVTGDMVTVRNGTTAVVAGVL